MLVFLILFHKSIPSLIHQSFRFLIVFLNCLESSQWELENICFYCSALILIITCFLLNLNSCKLFFLCNNCCLFLLLWVHKEVLIDLFFYKNWWFLLLRDLDYLLILLSFLYLFYFYWNLLKIYLIPTPRDLIKLIISWWYFILWLTIFFNNFNLIIYLLIF